MTATPLTQRKRDPEEKRGRLLQAARDLFIGQGFDGTTTKQIAIRSGVSEGILFHQFDNKLGVLKELVRLYTEEAIAEFLPEGQTGITYETVIRRVISSINRDQELFQVVEANSALLKSNGIPVPRDLILPAIENSLRSACPDVSQLPASLSVMAEFQYAIVETSFRGWLKSETDEEKEAFVREGVRSLEAMVTPYL